MQIIIYWENFKKKLVNFSHIPKFKILGCDKTTPLKGISPRDSQSRKESKSRNDQNGIWVDEVCSIHWGILSFFNNHLVDSSSSKILLSSHENRVGTSIGRWVGWRHPIEVWSQFGARMSIVVLFFVVETSPLNWILRDVWSCMQPLHVLIPSSRILKITGVLEHLALQSCIALFCWMGPLLELLLDSRHCRVDLAVGSWRGYHCHIRAVLLIGTDISKVILFSIVVALLVGRSSCHILVALGWGR
jgi:hypothetical protein